MEFQDFIGYHILSGVDYEGGIDGANAIRFRIDGVIYIAMEDREDGYRSCMGSLEVSDLPMNNTFRGIPVIGVVTKTINEDILSFVSVKTGKEVLAIGTDYGDSWYPCYVSSWTPENM